MTKRILEKMYGERIILICENDANKSGCKSGNASIKLIGENKEIDVNCSIVVPNSCFSEPRIIHIMLPEGFKESEIETIESIEIG